MYWINGKPYYGNWYGYKKEKENAENGFDSSKYSPDNMMRSAQNYISKSSSLPQIPKINIPNL